MPVSEGIWLVAIIPRLPTDTFESFGINGHFRSRVRPHEKFFILTAAPLTCYNWKGNGEWRIVDSSLTCFRPCCTSTFTPRLRWQTRWVYNCGRCNTTLRTLIVRKADPNRLQLFHLQHPQHPVQNLWIHQQAQAQQVPQMRRRRPGLRHADHWLPQAGLPLCRRAPGRGKEAPLRQRIGGR